MEICNNDIWGTVCDDFWDTADAQVVCRQLGFDTIGATALTTGFPNGVGQIWLDDVQCAGSESRLVDCSLPPFGMHNCAHFEDAGVSCPICESALKIIHHRVFAVIFTHLPFNLY